MATFGKQESQNRVISTLYMAKNDKNFFVTM